VKIFFSHSNREKPLIREIIGQLPQFLRSWLDEDRLCWGEDFGIAIETEINEQSDYVLLFLDRDALKSEWVNRELEWALNREQSLELRRQFILPVLTENFPHGQLPSKIASRHYLQLTDRQSSNVRTLASEITLRLFKLILERINSTKLQISNGSLEYYFEKIRLMGKSPNFPMVKQGLRALSEFADIPIQCLKKQLYQNLESLVSGKYYINGSSFVYQHDGNAIRELKSNDFYKATHPFYANPEAVKGIDRVAFRAYMLEQEEAAKRGVKIIRIYIVPDADNLDSLDRFQLKHLKCLLDTNIDVRVISHHELDDKNDLSDDFVLIGDVCVGTAIPKKGEMIISEYQWVTTPAMKWVYQKYESYFDDLYRVSRPLSSIINKEEFHTIVSKANIDKIRQPAFVLRTPVNICQKESKRLMVVLRTNGCFYHKEHKECCIMCNFKQHSIPDINVVPEWLLNQLENALENIKIGEGGVEQIDLLTLGSSLHDKEVPSSFISQAFRRFSSTVGLKKILIESRTEYVNKEKLIELKKMLREDQILELGIGVETTNETLRQEIIKKGMPWSEVERVVRVCSETGVSFQAYLLIGTMTLSESDVVTDAVKSAHEIADLCNKYEIPFRIAFEPVFITHNTDLEVAYNKGEYKLINLWSVVDVIRKTHHLGTLFVGMSDEGLSDNRIPTSCPKCMERLRESIANFNGAQKIEIFENINCDCQSMG